MQTHRKTLVHLHIHPRTCTNHSMQTHTLTHIFTDIWILLSMFLWNVRNISVHILDFKVSNLDLFELFVVWHFLNAYIASCPYFTYHMHKKKPCCLHTVAGTQVAGQHIFVCITHIWLHCTCWIIIVTLSSLETGTWEQAGHYYSVIYCNTGVPSHLESQCAIFLSRGQRKTIFGCYLSIVREKPQELLQAPEHLNYRAPANNNFSNYFFHLYWWVEGARHSTHIEMNENNNWLWRCVWFPISWCLEMNCLQPTL